MIYPTNNFMKMKMYILNEHTEKKHDQQKIDVLQVNYTSK